MVTSGMRVLKRRKSNADYFYLQHSFRTGRIVKTKEKYLGKRIPVDIPVLMERLRDECNREGLFVLFEKIRTGFQREWKRYPKGMQEKIKRQLAVDFTYNTNAIEGSTISWEETRGIVEDRVSPQRPLGDVKETEAHVRVFLAMIEEPQVLDKGLILGWHKELFRETKADLAGKFREYLVRVGRYRAPDWQDVDHLMKELVLFFNQSTRMNPVELAARVHYRFEKIHPFGDGNGRVGRLLMNFILWCTGYPILIIEYKKRSSYYRALGKDEDHFFQYFSRRYLRAYRRFL
ncbi:hypothetical protein CMO92_00615 [Candidatus Woesearchaeota archaeon]|nr:hypothetical protein [Candidatus Woesearchaeota archaeon]|tara:strand:- start:534 stop:1403 length:870 start_codon:yes stop_codon:yes gene_type:complete